MADPTVKINVQIDRSKMTFGDMRFILKMKKGATADEMDKLFEMLDRIIIGGVDNIPLDAMDAVIAALSEAMSQDEHTKN